MESNRKNQISFVAMYNKTPLNFRGDQGTCLTDHKEGRSVFILNVTDDSWLTALYDKTDSPEWSVYMEFTDKEQVRQDIFTQYDGWTVDYDNNDLNLPVNDVNYLDISLEE